MTIRTALVLNYATLAAGVIALVAYVRSPIVEGHATGGGLIIVGFIWSSVAIQGIRRLKRRIREAADIGEKVQ